MSTLAHPDTTRIVMVALRKFDYLVTEANSLDFALYLADEIEAALGRSDCQDEQR